MSVNHHQKDSGSAIASDLGSQEARLHTLQPAVRINDGEFKNEFEKEFDKAVKTIKKIRDIYDQE